MRRIKEFHNNNYNFHSIIYKHTIQNENTLISIQNQ